MTDMIIEIDEGATEAVETTDLVIEAIEKELIQNEIFLMKNPISLISHYLFFFSFFRMPLNAIIS